MRRYLAEFLSDPRVVGLPRALWLPLLHALVLPLRAPRSAHKYAQIWTPQGSPLAVHTARQAELLVASTGWQVEYAMRYGEPGIASGLGRFASVPTVLPLYPQYSESATGSVLALVKGRPAVRDFHAHPAYIAALAATIGPRRRSPKLVMSFHGLPKRGSEEYEAQCRKTGLLLSQALNLREGEWLITFQSRFGLADWLQPYTQPTLEKLASKGTVQVDVACPGFVSDCLETLEEIGITARSAFLAAGGKELNLIPCLNEAPEWIEAIARIASDRAGP